MKRHFLFSLLVLAFLKSFAQDHPGTLQVRHIDQDITLDGEVLRASIPAAGRYTG